MIGIDITPLVLERRRGVARALLTLLHGLDQVVRPTRVVLLAPRAIASQDEIPELDGVHVTEATTARRFRRLLPRLVREAGITTFISPWLAAPRLDVPVLVWVHELPFVRLGPIEGRVRAMRQRAWLRRHLRRDTRFVTPSRSTREDLLTLHPELEGRAHVVHNAFDPGPWRLAAREPDEPSYAVIVGTGRGAAGARKKGMDLIPGLETALAGRLAVRVLGDTHIDEEGLRDAVAGARVLVYPSRSEGFGYPPLEAMAAGVPVVASQVGAITEFVGGAGLLVEPGDAEALRAAVLRAAFEDDMRRTLIENGHGRAQRFPPAEIARSWLALLATVGASA